MEQLVLSKINSSSQLSPDRVGLVATSYPLSMQPNFYEVPEGFSISDLLDTFILNDHIKLTALVFINETYIPREYWSRVYPKKGVTVSVKVLPQNGGGGKKNPLAVVLSLAVLAAAAWAGPMIAGALTGATSGTGFSIASGLASGLISAVGNLIVSAIAPPGKQRQTISTNEAETQQLFIEGARNSSDPFGVVPIAFGKVRVVPKLSAGNYTESAGDDQYVRQLFCWGLGKYDLTTLVNNLKIGETAITEYSDVELQHDMAGLGADATNLTLYPNDIFQEDLNLQIKQANGWTVHTSQVGATSLIADITLPTGCVEYNDQGEKNAHGVVIEARYKLTSSGTWSATQTLTINLARSTAVRRCITFKDLPAGQYDVSIRRTTADATTDKVFDTTWWTALRTVTNDKPVLMKGISQTAMRIKATDQLSGAVDQLNSLLLGLLPDYNYTTDTWIERATQNPASFFRCILQNSSLWKDVEGNFITDAPNARGLPDERIHLDSIQEFHDHCRVNGFQYNSYIDFDANVYDMLHEVAAAGRAAPTLIDGKWGVVIDRAQTIIQQHFTTSNSWGFEANRIFPDVPHAFRVQFSNELNGYFTDERLVYADGYNAENATKIEGLQLPGITHPDLIYKHAREHLATLLLRATEYSFMTDVESLKVMRGGLIKFSHRVPLFGLEDGYVTDLILDETDPDNIMVTGIMLDRPVFMESGKTYSMRFRDTATNSSIYCDLNTVVGPQETVTFTSPVAYVRPAGEIREDCLFMFGETGKETIDLVVKDIIPDKNLTAKLICFDAAPQIFAASQGTIPPFESQITVPAELLRPVAPKIISIQTGAEVQVYNLDGTVSNRMVITLRNDNVYEVVPVVKIKQSDAAEFEYAHVIAATPTQIVIEGLSQGTRYDFQLMYKKVGNNSTSMFGGTTYSTITPKNLVLFEGVSDRPPNITNYHLQVVGTSIIHVWDPITVLDFDHYEIRYSPNLSGVSWDTAAVLKSYLTNNETITPAATGIFLIKAYDRGGRASVDPTLASISVVLEGTNAVENVIADPTFTGTHVNTTVVSNALRLNNLALGTGTFTLPGYTDLSEVYSCTITPHLVVNGLNVSNVMSSWTSLSSLTSLSGTPDGGWNVALQASFTDDDPASGGAVWTDWAPLGIGQKIFRAVKFRIILNGNGANITPNVEELRILIDMPDRVVKQTAVAVPSTGLTITYSPAFKNDPAVNMTIKDGSSGDKIRYTSKGRTGFTVFIDNSSGTPVNRTIDFTSTGYGRVNT